jgi:hypothetical protein
MANIFIHQIFYNEATRAAVAPGFIGLDNTANLRPDWFEFWVMRNWLNANPLEEGAWYGFLSPKFTAKTGYSAAAALEMIAAHDADGDVVLFPTGWDQLAYFLNPFEQGEVWHPGLTALSQCFFDAAGYDIDLESLVTHAGTSVFSNFIIAKPAYWRAWLALANRFFEMAESPAGLPELARNTSYETVHNQVPMKTFIQERLASVILARGGFRVVAPDASQHMPVRESMFPGDPRTRRMLQACDLLKERHCATGDADYLEIYYRIRQDIDFHLPMR